MVYNFFQGSVNVFVLSLFVGNYLKYFYFTVWFITIEKKNVSFSFQHFSTQWSWYYCFLYFYSGYLHQTVCTLTCILSNILSLQQYFYLSNKAEYFYTTTGKAHLQETSRWICNAEDWLDLSGETFSPELPLTGFEAQQSIACSKWRPGTLFYTAIVILHLNRKLPLTQSYNPLAVMGASFYWWQVFIFDFMCVPLNSTQQFTFFDLLFSVSIGEICFFD